MPTYHDLAPLLRFKRPQVNLRKRRLASAATIHDLRRVAKRVTPRAVFDYADGAAEGELSLSRARQAFSDIEFHPEVLRDVSAVDTSRDILGGTSALPFGIAPTGFTRMMQTEGERAGATAAASAGIPFTLSTMSTTSIEDVAAVAPEARRWFQLYMWQDRERSLALVDRACAAGFDTLVVTVDTPVGGARLRDVRNGMTVPPSLTPRTVLDAVPRPAWWMNFLTGEPLAFASLDRWSGTVADLIRTMFDPTVVADDLRLLREHWKGKLVVKGIQSIEAARLAVDLGADGIVLSNHGGRQLDRAPVPFHLLPRVVAEVGRDTEVLLDTGIMNGADIVASVAMGARFTLIGRAYLYGLMAGGREGVDRAVQILSDEVVRTMKLLGVASLDQLSPEHVTQLVRMIPLARGRE
ncbi:alpha-hydroxy acid oxidase [Streptomyces brasiliensis]|uniref:Putative L-lactate dehydrogenase n=1 Tax=Streptomyces brasiliensis TaxID=1954 RepID=A0A917K9V4_9ACTN|nr:alpha-hydroxy acid oxidase [Streptomyces brasiliensis]GGJ06307.1 alpha-hydroxy-acid oxidizing enzyme [Streptomyces brasiliensis]